MFGQLLFTSSAATKLRKIDAITTPTLPKTLAHNVSHAGPPKQTDDALAHSLGAKSLLHRG